ncbi:MAG TPA: SulP family inorganic anion transporter, partial [bacterium]|nr:SulP family inorganic anion transporter [bacterium]
MFKPKLFIILKYYTKEMFINDLIAGVIVGIVALPLAIAFGIASGVTPEQGIITAIIAGFIISFLGGSRVQIGGPTGAFIVIVVGVIREYGIGGLTIATIIAGILLIMMACLKLGDVIKFIPYPVTVGFTSGIAVVIFSTQIKDFFGFPIKEVPAHFIEQIFFYFHIFNRVNHYALFLALLTILIIVYFPKITTKIPGSLIAIIITTLIVYYFKFPVETIGTKFGEIKSVIPKPIVPLIDYKTLTKLLPAAFTIAMLGAIESLLSATVADGMIGGNHNSNTELFAQGVANVITPIFGGIPATGAIARTATNIKNGAKSPIAGIIHAIILLLIFLFFGKLAALIPMPCLAGI